LIDFHADAMLRQLILLYAIYAAAAAPAPCACCAAMPAIALLLPRFAASLLLLLRRAISG